MAIHKILGATAICAIVLGVVPTQAQTQEQSDETGAYVGVNWARSDLDGFRENYSDGSSLGIADTKGDGFGFTFGYRIDGDLRFELEFQQIDYDSTPMDINNVTVAEVGSFESDWLALSIVWQGKMGLRHEFQPFIKLSYFERDASFTFRAPGYQQATFAGDYDGEAWGGGLDYMMKDDMLLRGQITFMDDDEQVITIGPIWRF